ncbi:hypothetical protein L2U69_10045 [Zavarzinia compransoris]|uniref:hypothetical protein n=1 Tax=Zavarzinia marina TaxID=2911065 RepID=UPI001F2B6850|nr:hypothetical protein [Zavarzinia marina]MCF4165984.1 hypothetical protein [Zavarzinia marina]
MIAQIVDELAAQPAGPVLVALMIDRLWPRRRALAPRPVTRAVEDLTRRLNRPERPVETRQSRGFLLWAVVALAALACGRVLAEGLSHWAGRDIALGVEILLLAAGIGFQGARAAARRAVAGVEGMAPGRAVQVGRVACDRLALRFSDGVVGITLGYMLLGLPGAFLVKAGQWLVEGLETVPEDRFVLAVRAAHGIVTAPASFLAALLIGFGRWPGPALLPPPAVRALGASLDAAGLVATVPAARLAGARTLVDRAHALWFVLLLAGSVAAALL